MRKKYPSQLRYEMNNPTITFRMKIKEKEKIQNMAINSGRSISELVRYALLGLEKDFTEICEYELEEGKKQGYKKGYENGFKEGEKKGSNDWAISVPCYVCRKPLFIVPNSPDYKQTLEEMRGRLKHERCYF